MEVAARTSEVAVPRLHGRDEERRRIDLLIGAARAGSGGSMILRGDVGAGKTALLHYALSAAAGTQVLRSQGDQAESGLRFAGLHQLLQPVLGLAGELPEGLRAPLDAALGGAGAGGFATGAAVLALLTRAARQRPLLGLVDDAQWLDEPSAGALSFAARRVRAGGIVLLVAVRDGEGRPFAPAGVAETRLADLDPGAAARLLAERAGRAVVPEVVRQLVERTGGLPLALADAAAGLTPAQLGGRVPLPQALPVGPRLRDTILRRVRRLPVPAQRLLLVVAAAGSARVDVVAEACAGLGVELPALASAEAAGLVQVVAGVIRFRSGPAQAAVYAEAPFFERRAAHLALAAAFSHDDEERRVRHLATAALSRDARLAADLERAAERAGLRGDLSARAEALQRAAQLTPDSQERGRRLVAAARVCWQAGRSVQAAELLDRAGRLRSSPLLDAEIAEVRGDIALRQHDLERAGESLVTGARRVAAFDPGRALDLLTRAARVAAAGSDAPAAETVARLAAALPAGQQEGAALLRGVAGVLDGRPEDAARVAGWTIATALDAGADSAHLLGLAASLCAGHDLAPEGLAAALERLGAEVDRLRAAGMAGALPAVLAALAWLDLWADRHRQAHANAAEGLSLARGLGQRWAECGCAATLAVLAALRGREEELAALAELLDEAPRSGAATWAAALADLGAGRFGEALARLDDLAPGGRPGQPWLAVWSRPDAVEAGVRSGHLERAEAALQALERAARPEWPAPAAALLARSRALLATGRDAERHYLSALALHAGSERPFQQARTRLLWAEHLRRARRRLDAREQLRAALAAFERLEARPWADRARTELRATGETVRRRDAGIDLLTPQERRIAELVADGESNREVAERLYLSPRTVGYHLARVYEKLGVSSRTRLARMLRDGELDTGARRRTGLSGHARATFRSRTAAAADRRAS
jgi:DNA-binding CsgD family transcriptional regulator